MSDLDVQNINSKTGNSAISIADDGTTTVSTFTSTGIDDNATSTAITIDASENVGIGTNPGRRLNVLGVDPIVAVIESSTTGAGIGFKDATTTGDNQITVRAIGQDLSLRGAGAIDFITNNAERMRIDASGNVGIGTSSPSALLDLVGGAASPLVLELSTANSNCDITMQSASTSSVTRLRNGTNDFQIHTNGTERMRIHSGGQLTYGTDTVGARGKTFNYNSNGAWIDSNQTYGYGWIHNKFLYNGTEVGKIWTTTTATNYQTTSDYRLKENLVGLDNGIDRLKQIPVYRFNFIADPNTTVDGFIAHEVQDVVPEAISGSKDAVNDEGNPEYQGIDQSKLVPLLTAALQEAVAKIEDLESRLSAVEAN